MKDRRRFLARLTSGTFPSPDAATSPGRSPTAFVLELSPTGAVAKRFSRAAQTAVLATVVAGLFGGLGLAVLLTPSGSAGSETIRLGTLAFFKALGVIMLIPLGGVGGGLAGRILLREWPRSDGIELWVGTVDFGAMFSFLDLVSDQGGIMKVRLRVSRDRLEDALRLARRMPPADRVFRHGFRP